MVEFENLNILFALDPNQFCVRSVFAKNKKALHFYLQSSDFQCRGSRIRTCDPLLPKQIR